MTAVVHSVDSLLESVVACGASDLHVTVGAPPSARVRGELQPLGDFPPFDAETIRTLVYRILTTEQQKRFEIDHELFPHRTIASTESHPSLADACWAGVVDNPNVIGDFTWTGWDYLGEVGVGRTEYGDEAPPLGMAEFLGGYPWLTAWCGDIDITGHRRPMRGEPIEYCRARGSCFGGCGRRGGWSPRCLR